MTIFLQMIIINQKNNRINIKKEKRKILFQIRMKAANKILKNKIHLLKKCQFLIVIVNLNYKKERSRFKGLILMRMEYFLKTKKNSQMFQKTLVNRLHYFQKLILKADAI